LVICFFLRKAKRDDCNALHPKISSGNRKEPVLRGIVHRGIRWLLALRSSKGQKHQFGQGRIEARTAVSYPSGYTTDRERSFRDECGGGEWSDGCWLSPAKRRWW